MCLVVAKQLKSVGAIGKKRCLLNVCLILFIFWIEFFFFFCFCYTKILAINVSRGFAFQFGNKILDATFRLVRLKRRYCTDRFKLERTTLYSNQIINKCCWFVSFGGGCGLIKRKRENFKTLNLKSRFGWFSVEKQFFFFGTRDFLWFTRHDYVIIVLEGYCRECPSFLYRYL